MNPQLLSLLIFLPFFAAILIAALPKARIGLARPVALTTAVIQLIITLILFIYYQQNGVSSDALSGYLLSIKVPWFRLDLGDWGIMKVEYFLGADGLSIPLLLLTSIIMLVATVASININLHRKAYYSLLLLGSGSIFGSFLALDFFLFYLFFEFMLLPMYFLIGLWGGANRLHASIKFFLYTLLGSIFILIVMIALHMSSNISTDEVVIHTFDLLKLANPENFISNSMLGWNSVGENSSRIRDVAFFVLMIGFAIKLPVVPFHTWLPDAHVEAPTPVSVILAGILLKVGGYAMIRIALPIFPLAAINGSYLIGWFGVLSILYGGLAALAQDDLKRLVAYSSVSHMGFVLLGIAALTVESLTGAVYQMVSHGLLSAALFLLVGVLYDRTGERNISHFSGLGKVMPVYTTLIIVAFFASMGLPGFSSFIAELFVLLGAFQNFASGGSLSLWMVIGAALGIVLAAGYFIWAIQRMFMGDLWVKSSQLRDTLSDASLLERSNIVPLLLLSLLLGVLPYLMLSTVSAPVSNIILQISEFIK